MCVVGHHTLLLRFERRGTTPSVRSNKAPMLLLPYAPLRTGLLIKVGCSEATCCMLVCWYVCVSMNVALRCCCVHCAT